MRIIISPAKKMNADTDSLPWLTLPQFLPEAEVLKNALQRLSEKDLQSLWKCNDALAALNTERLRTMQLQKRLTPAILSYEGIQYQYMAPGVLEQTQLAYLSEHLRILSGFYGLLRPFDGIVPYRLEMQAALRVGKAANLYAYWGDKLCRQLCSETDCILNLASKEYSKAVTAHLPHGVRCITFTFGQKKDGKVLEKGTLCKMARGEMVRFLAEENITRPEHAKRFCRLGYTYAAEASQENHFVFLKGG